MSFSCPLFFFIFFYLPVILSRDSNPFSPVTRQVNTLIRVFC
nr:MAG TPA: hypothetical protein [Caudoviricetes sp.]